MARDLAWIRDQTEVVLNANPLQADANFTTSQLNFSINEVCDQELNKAKSETYPHFFLETEEFTWPADARTYDLTGTALDGADVYRYLLVTDTGLEPLHIDFDYRDKNTLVWRNRKNGPSGDQTIRALYWPAANELSNDSDEPNWIVPSHRNLLVWSAAIVLHEIAYNMDAPQAWLRRRDEYRYSWYKTLESRPMATPSRVTHETNSFGLEGSEGYGLEYYYQYD